MARTAPSHGANRGSIPRGATDNTTLHRKDRFARPAARLLLSSAFAARDGRTMPNACGVFAVQCCVVCFPFGGNRTSGGGRGTAIGSPCRRVAFLRDSSAPRVPKAQAAAGRRAVRFPRGVFCCFGELESDAEMRDTVLDPACQAIGRISGNAVLHERTARILERRGDCIASSVRAARILVKIRCVVN